MHKRESTVECWRVHVKDSWRIVLKAIARHRNKKQVHVKCSNIRCDSPSTQSRRQHVRFSHLILADATERAQHTCTHTTSEYNGSLYFFSAIVVASQHQSHSGAWHIFFSFSFDFTQQRAARFSEMQVNTERIVYICFSTAGFFPSTFCCFSVCRSLSMNNLLIYIYRHAEVCLTERKKAVHLPT